MANLSNQFVYIAVSERIIIRGMENADRRGRCLDGFIAWGLSFVFSHRYKD